MRRCECKIHILTYLLWLLRGLDGTDKAVGCVFGCTGELGPSGCKGNIEGVIEKSRWQEGGAQVF